MPEEIIVASWRVMTVSSAALTRFGMILSSTWSPLFFSASSITWSPRPRSSSVTALLLGALDLALGGRAGAVDAPCT